jgi:hypothetical protein
MRSVCDSEEETEKISRVLSPALASLNNKQSKNLLAFYSKVSINITQGGSALS